MDSVFLLWYVIAPDSANEEDLLIGAYSTEEEANFAIARLKDKPGFANSLEGFQIHRHGLNRDGRTDGFIVTKD